MNGGSPLWQGALFLCAMFFLAFELWRGWRAGFARAGINFAAVVISTVVALFAGQMAAAPFGGFKDPAGFLAAGLIGGGLGTFVFFVLWLTGIIFFKRTDHQGSGIFRWFWGAGGAFFGFLMGLLILWGGISVIRSLGVLAEARVEVAKSHAAPPAPAVPGVAPAPPPTPPPFAAAMVKLKESLELGPAGKFVESVDVMPPDFYELVLATARLTGDQEALIRFLEYPGLQEVLKSPKLAELLNDPTIVQAGTEQNFAALLSNPKLLAAVKDPVLAEQLGKVDLRAALNYALEKPSPADAASPPPVPRRPTPPAE